MERGGVKKRRTAASRKVVDVILEKRKGEKVKSEKEKNSEQEG